MRISNINYSMVMQFMPLPEETKLEMYIEIMSYSKPIFKDKTVIILMILISVFDLEGDQSVKRIKSGFFGILRGYLEEHTNNDVEFEMKNIAQCINGLPKLNNIFKDMTNNRGKNSTTGKGVAPI